MKKDEAERLVVTAPNVVRRTGNSQASNADALLFFGEISKDRKDLLEFNARGDKWQVIKGFLSHAGLIPGG